MDVVSFTSLYVSPDITREASRGQPRRIIPRANPPSHMLPTRRPTLSSTTITPTEEVGTPSGHVSHSISLEARRAHQQHINVKSAYFNL